MGKIKKTLLIFETKERFNFRSSEKLRGFFSNLYPERDYFHNHDENSKSIYRMPLVQYKVIDGKLTVIGINEGAELVAKEFLKHDFIVLENKKINILGKEFRLLDEDFEVTDEFYKYKFRSIWLPINQKNIKEYREGKLDLDKVLRNNILSNFKGAEIRIEKKIEAKGFFKEKEVYIKNKKMIGFVGDFIANVKHPEHLGIGKRRSIGFGDVIRYD